MQWDHGVISEYDYIARTNIGLDLTGSVTGFELSLAKRVLICLGGKLVNRWADHYVTQMLDSMQSMSLHDYAHVALALVLVGWAMTRMR